MWLKVIAKLVPKTELVCRLKIEVIMINYYK